MPMPDAIFVTELDSIPIDSWGVVVDKDGQSSFPYGLDAEGKPIDPKNADKIRYYKIMYPVLPLDYINPLFLAYGYKNAWAVDSETGERFLREPIPIEMLGKFLPFNVYSQNVASASLMNKAKKWGLDKDNLKSYPEIQARFEDWSTKMAGGDRTPPIEDMGNIVNRIRSYIPSSESSAPLITDKNTQIKMATVRQAWANALQRGDVDLANQSQYTSMFARTLFENLLPREDMDLADFQKVMRLVETPQGFNNFIRTVNDATTKAQEQGLSPEGTQQKIKDLVATNIRQRLELEPYDYGQPVQSSKQIAQGKARPNLTGSLTPEQMGIDTSKPGTFWSPDLARLIPIAEGMGIDTSFTKSSWGSPNPASAIVALNQKITDVSRSYVEGQSAWLAQQFPNEYAGWQANLRSQTGLGDLSQYGNLFVEAAGEQAPTDEAGSPNPYYYGNFGETIKKKLGATTLRWLREGRRNITSPYFEVPEAVRQDIERTQKYNELKAEAEKEKALSEQEQYQLRNRPQKVAKL